MKNLMIAGSFVFLMLACSKNDNVSPTGVPTGSFDEVIAAGGGFDPVTESNALLETTLEDELIDGDAWRCVTETYEANYGGGGDSGFPQFNPNASVDRYRLIFNEAGDKYVVAVESWGGGYYLGPFGI